MSTHLTQQTSIVAYYESLPILGKRELEVLRGYAKYPEYTDLMLATKLGYTDPNKVRPRRKELCNSDLLFCVGNRVCSVSKKVVKCWRLTEKGRNVLFTITNQEKLLKLGLQNHATNH